MPRSLCLRAPVLKKHNKFHARRSIVLFLKKCSTRISLKFDNFFCKEQHLLPAAIWSLSRCVSFWIVKAYDRSHFMQFYSSVALTIQYMYVIYIFFCFLFILLGSFTEDSNCAMLCRHCWNASS